MKEFSPGLLQKDETVSETTSQDVSLVPAAKTENKVV